jgi:predicted nuclease of predicted toxin-antitoxin system
MKILLDESIDIRFKKYLSDSHDVFTVKDMHWTGIKNGELLLLLKERKFDVWIVVDKNIPYQQNIATLPCKVIVLDVVRNTLKHLTPLSPKILEILNSEINSNIVVIPKS